MEEKGNDEDDTQGKLVPAEGTDTAFSDSVSTASRETPQ